MHIIGIMKLLKYIFVSLLTILFYQNLSAQTSFEGVITSRVTVGGVDFGKIIEKIDYNKPHIQDQFSSLYKNLPPQSLVKLQEVIQKNPMMGLVLVMTPPQATIYIKGKVVNLTARGLGYQIQHYHDEQLDQASIYTNSLIQPQNAVTSIYKPSEGYRELFGNGKYINLEHFQIQRLSKTAIVANYPCAIATYTPKNTIPSTNQNAGGLPIHKLVVYTNKDIPKGINFSHPYYLPENNGILRIDIYLDKGEEPTMVYEIVDIKKTMIGQNLLLPKKNDPTYVLKDPQYSMKVLGIMMQGMSLMQNDDDED